MESYLLDDPQAEERFIIDNDGAADWAVRRILSARRNRDKLIAHHKEQIEQAGVECERVEGFFGPLLQMYFETLPLHDTKTQSSYKMASGKLLLTKPKPEYKPDNEQFVQWLEANGYADFVQTVKKAAWGEFKKQTALSGLDVIDTTTGEVVQGVKVEMRPAEFTVKEA